MDTKYPDRIRELLDRLGRVVAAEEWNEDLNPAQRSALAYLGRANEFSRAPSNVADYICTTRGTASQTLKALERKGFISQVRSTSDKRSIRYDVTKSGHEVLQARDAFDDALEGLSDRNAADLSQLLETTTHGILEKRGFRSFGVCKTCRHHKHVDKRPYCALLQLQLTKQAAEQLCYEHDLTGA